MLDPRSVESAINYQGLGPRLDTVDGKNIVVLNQHGGNEDAMRSIGPALQAQYPNCIMTPHEASGMWHLDPPEIQYLVDTFDGCITGENY